MRHFRQQFMHNDMQTKYMKIIVHFVTSFSVYKYLYWNAVLDLNRVYMNIERLGHEHVDH